MKKKVSEYIKVIYWSFRWRKELKIDEALKVTFRLMRNIKTYEETNQPRSDK